MNPENLSLAHKCYAHGQFKDAVEAYEEVIKSEPENVLAHYWLGWSYNQLGRYESAKIAFDTVVRLAPGSEGAQRAQKWLEWKRGIPQQVEKEEPESVSCKHCGASNPKTNKFCGQCSANLTSESASIASAKPEKTTDSSVADSAQETTKVVPAISKKPRNLVSVAEILRLILICVLVGAAWYVLKPVLLNMAPVHLSKNEASDATKTQEPVEQEKVPENDISDTQEQNQTSYGSLESIRSVLYVKPSKYGLTNGITQNLADTVITLQDMNYEKELLSFSLNVKSLNQLTDSEYETLTEDERAAWKGLSLVGVNLMADKAEFYGQDEALIGKTSLGAWDLRLIAIGTQEMYSFEAKDRRKVPDPDQVKEIRIYFIIEPPS